MDIQTTCGDIVNEILNPLIEAEQTFKYGQPNDLFGNFYGIRDFHSNL